MAKKGKKPKKDEAATTESNVVGSSTPIQDLEIDMIPLGVPNLIRSFQTNDNTSAPQIILHQVRHSLPLGWSDSAAYSTNDPSAAITRKADPADALYAMTSTSQAFRDEYLPVLEGIIERGLGARYDISSPFFTRYFSIVIDVLEKLQMVLNVNYIWTSLDWSTIAPFSANPPQAAEMLKIAFDAGDVGMADRWQPYFDRLADHVLPPSIRDFIIDLTLPRFSTPYGHQLCIGGQDWDTTIAAGNPNALETEIGDQLDYLDATYISGSGGGLKVVTNPLKSFIPWRVGYLWSALKNYDQQLETARYNSGLRPHFNWGTVGVTYPGINDAIIMGDPSGYIYQSNFFSTLARPNVGEVVRTTIFEIVDDTTDYWWNMSNVLWGPTTLFDDDGDSVAYDSSLNRTATEVLFSSYLRNRFMVDDSAGTGSAVDYGRGRAGMTLGTLACDQVSRVNRDYLLRMLDLKTLRTVSDLTAGSSLREIRKAMASAFSIR